MQLGLTYLNSKMVTMKAKQFFLIIGFVFLNISYSYGQYQTVEQYIYFKSKMDSPIAIDVINQDDKYIFYADNRSFYSYQIQIHFDQLFNLIPELVNRDFEVLPGRSCLFTLSVKNKEMKSTFAYSFSSKIGIPRGNADFEFPYLFPIGDGKPVELFYYLSDSIIYIRDCFKLNEGDTVFNMWAMITLSCLLFIHPLSIKLVVVAVGAIGTAVMGFVVPTVISSKFNK